jgi:EAL domain-containing protein (putative c-di-GMP-specific phosphodiesterase class I)
MVGLANALGIEPLAEGVETQAQQSFLEGIGCHTMQGYYFGRPVWAAEFTALLRAQQEATPVAAGAGDSFGGAGPVI